MFVISSTTKKVVDLPSKLMGEYTKAKRPPTSSLVKAYSDVPVDMDTKSLGIEKTAKKIEITSTKKTKLEMKPRCIP
jgi:hypothetical protein